MAKAICGAKKKQGEGVCQQPAGWGTDHPGEGRCKLHGGRGARRGRENPAFRHGLYAKHLSEEELVEFEEFAARFDLARVSEEDKFAFYRVYRALSLPGPLSLPVAAQTLLALARAKASLLAALEGQVVRLHVDGHHVDAVARVMAQVLVKYVPPDNVEAALDELADAIRGLGGPAGGVDAEGGNSSLTDDGRSRRVGAPVPAHGKRRAAGL